MADAKPSRPISQRSIVEGKVEIPEGAELESAGSPQVGTYNDQGAQVESVTTMAKSRSVRVDYV